MCQEAFVYAGQLKFRLVSYIKTWPESCSNSNDHSLQPWQTEKHLRLHNMPNLESWYLSYCILPVHWTTLFILLWPFTSARHFCLQNCLTQDVFHTFLCRGVGGVCVKSLEISGFWNTQTSPSGTNNHSTVEVTAVTLSPFCIWFYAWARDWQSVQDFEFYLVVVTKSVWECKKK